MKPNRNITDPQIAKALAHPLRVRILGVLEEETASPRQLADRFEANLGVVSYHVRALARMGLLVLVREEPRRGAIEHYYRAVDRPVVTSDAWRDMPTVAKQAIVSASLDQVAEQVAAAAVTGGFDRPDSHLTRSPMRLDEQGFREVAARLDALLEEFESIASAAEERLAAKDHEGEVAATAVLMLLESAPVKTGKARGSRARPAKRHPTRGSSHSAHTEGAAR